MKKLELDEVSVGKWCSWRCDFYISEDSFKEYLKHYNCNGSMLNFALYDLIEFTFDRYPEFEKYIGLFSKLNDLEKIAVIDAHGSSSKNKWMYKDNNKKFPLQSLMKKIDGKYAGIILNVCNKNLHELKSKSPVIIPDGIVSITDLNPFVQGVTLSLFKNGKRLEFYNIENEIKKMENDLKFLKNKKSNYQTNMSR